MKELSGRVGELLERICALSKEEGEEKEPIEGKTVSEEIFMSG